MTPAIGTLILLAVGMWGFNWIVNATRLVRVSGPTAREMEAIAPPPEMTLTMCNGIQGGKLMVDVGNGTLAEALVTSVDLEASHDDLTRMRVEFIVPNAR